MSMTRPSGPSVLALWLWRLEHRDGSHLELDVTSSLV